MILVPPRPDEWQARFQAHQARLDGVLPGADIQHIGSTAIPGLQAKDVVDVLVGVPAGQITPSARRLQHIGYVLEGEREGHAWLCWPTPQAREAVIHVMVAGGEPARKRLLFRDALRADPVRVREYEALKLAIAAHTDDWGEYTRQKADFVQEILNGF